jgi:hypothetical protein
MSPVIVKIGPPPTPITPTSEVEFDPATFVPEVVPDLDALAESAKCSCNASDDNPY